MSPTDRRAVVIALTPQGRRTAKAIRKAVTDLERRALHRLPPAAVDGFHLVLTALTEVSP
jgi:DNA-binding MarR family transcriptional regulator